MRTSGLILALLLGGCATSGGLQQLRPDAAAYKALGTEPFWSLTIDQRVMVFTEAGRDEKVTVTTPRVINGVAGDIYKTQRLNVNIVHGRCSDGMSDRVYPDKVQVRVDGRAFEGCGGEPLAPGTLAGTSWTVESVNGQPVPGGPANFVRFTENRLSARFGCNTLNGRFAQSDITLSTGALAATRMACPDMTAERTATRILAQPVTIVWASGERLTLGNGNGSIVLKRVI